MKSKSKHNSSLNLRVGSGPANNLEHVLSTKCPVVGTFVDRLDELDF
jgi:hypothetical protein